ncbi:MAG: ArsA family ATPase [Sciscionella sp.]|nr:ArsA family ATPase [Sciscionella sp.]
MRAIFFTGKGGVGKTTLAAATAARLASAGNKVLVVSTDPAHSLGDAFGVALGMRPTELAAGLFAGHVDARALTDDAWQQLRGYLAALLSGVGVADIDAEELTVLPGVEELLALAEVQRLADSGAWQVLVVDCGPTAETLRLLALPEAFAGYLRKLFPDDKRALRGVLSRLAMRRGGLGGGLDRGRETSVENLGATTDALVELGHRLTALHELLTAEDTSVRLVLTPERVVVAETRRTLTALALQGIAVDGVIANRVVPRSSKWRGPAAKWMRLRRAEQDAVLADLRADSDLPIRLVEHAASEPVGVPALLALAQQLYGDEDPRNGQALQAPLLSVTGGGRGADVEYRLRIAVPLGADATPDLARIGDDLAVTVDGRRRLIALPSVLRRCDVLGAEFDQAGVVVRLAPRQGGGEQW